MLARCESKMMRVGTELLVLQIYYTCMYKRKSVGICHIPNVISSSPSCKDTNTMAMKAINFIHTFGVSFCYLLLVFFLTVISIQTSKQKEPFSFLIFVKQMFFFNGSQLCTENSGTCAPGKNVSSLMTSFRYFSRPVNKISRTS